MTRPIDEKIVVMKLDNSDFARKATETTSLFGKLRNSLNKIPGVNLGNTTKELANISTNADAGNTNLNNLATSVQNISSRFSTLGVVATTALVNISNRAVDAGINIAKSLTLDQVTAGFSEYELKMKSIKTILANTEWAGTTLDDVKGSLEELNTYADQTIYNFAQMTDNIGRFTTAGVKLEDATIAIKGLSNLAAVSGSDVNQLNTAMYQMSQMMAAGKMNLMDWNSLVNAGMAGKKTQDALLETAKSMGVNVDMSEGFRNSIEQGWLTSEVFLETLKKFGNDKSMIEAATKVRTFTAFMDTLKESIGSGWALTFEQIFGDFEESTELWSGLAESVTGWVGKTSEARNKWFKGVADGGGMQNIFDGIQNASKPIIQIFNALTNGFKRVFPPLFVSEAIAITEAFKEFTAGLTLTGPRVQQLTQIFRGVFSIFSTVWEITKRLASAFIQLIPEGTAGGVLDFVEKIAEMAINFNESVKAGNGLTDFIDGLGTVLGAVGRTLGDVIGKITNFSGSLTENIGRAVDWVVDKLRPFGSYLTETFDGFGGNEVLGVGILAGIYVIFNKITGIFEDFLDKRTVLLSNITDMFDGVGDALNSFATGVKYANLMMIAISVGILAVSLKTLEGIKGEDIAKGITSLAVALGVMIGGMMLIDKFNVTGGMRAAVSLIALATAVSIMAGSLKKIADLNPEEVKTGIVGLVGVTGALALAIIAISKWGGKIKASSLQLLALSGAIYILADAVEKMSSMDTGNLFISIGAMGLLFAQLAIFLKVVDRVKFGVGSALAVLAIAGALQVMVNAITKIQDLNVPELVKGLSTIAIILAQIAIFSKLVSGGNLFVASVGILAIAGALQIMAGPIETFSNMSWTELAKGLGAMAVALLAVAGASLLASGAVGGAVAITLIAVALKTLIGPLETFSNMTWGEIIKGFAGLAGSLVIIAVAAMALTPAIPSMIGFGAALLIVGTAMLAAGAGIALFGTGLATLATMTAVSVAAIVGALALIVQGLIDLIPQVVIFLVDLGNAIIDGLASLVPPLVTMIVDVVMHILNTLYEKLPEFLEVGIAIITKLIEGIGEYVPILVEAATQAIIDLINGMSAAIRDNGPELISAVLGLLGEILLLVVEAGVQLINALLGWIPGVQTVTSAIGETAETHIRNNFGAGQAGRDKGDEFASGLSGKKGVAETAGGAIAAGAESGSNTADLSTIGKGHGGDFASALSAMTSSARSSGVGIAEGGKSGAGSISMSSTGSNFGLGFAGGINSESVMSSVVSAGISIATAAKNAVAGWLDMRSPSRLMKKDGGFFTEGFAIGIKDKAKTVAENAKGVAITAKNSLNKFLDGFELPEEDNELHFKAVIDYDRLDPRMFGNLRPLSFKPDTSLTRDLADSTRTKIRQNNDKTLTGNIYDEKTGMLLASIDDKISRIDPDKPVYLVLKDKIIGQSVTREVIDNYDVKYMKAERGLADA